jgi:hypothetical protein
MCSVRMLRGDADLNTPRGQSDKEFDLADVGGVGLIARHDH